MTRQELRDQGTAILKALFWIRRPDARIGESADRGSVRRRMDGASDHASRDVGWRQSGVVTGAIKASAIALLRAIAGATPTAVARTPSAKAPNGCVPMHAERMPMAPPRRSSAADRSTRMLCIVENPDSAAPSPRRMIAHAQRQCEPENTRRGGMALPGPRSRRGADAR